MLKRAYACFNLQEDTRIKSSSGGIFSLLVKKIIEKKGVIFGARFDENWVVVHDYAESSEAAGAFSGSKYVQSSMGDMFFKVKYFLQNDRIVLFSGTPCQVNGLKSYLGKEYDNLLTVDFICHGVPSPKVWEQYLRKCSAGKRISEINFRDKTEGWKSFGLKIEFQDGSNYRKNQFKDTYLKGFLKDIYLRPSCYECKFKGMDRVSDITLADFWGIENVSPGLFDDKGISAVLIHSKLGENIWNEICNQVKAEEVSPEMVAEYNKNAVQSVHRPKLRDSFFDATDDEIVQKIEKSIRITKLKKIKSIVKCILVKLRIRSRCGN